MKELVTHTCCSQGNKHLHGGWKLFLPSCKHYLILSLDLGFLIKKIGLIGLQDSNPTERKCSTISTVKFHLTQPSSNPTLKKKKKNWQPWAKTQRVGGVLPNNPTPLTRQFCWGLGDGAEECGGVCKEKCDCSSGLTFPSIACPHVFFAKCDCLVLSMMCSFMWLVLVHIQKNGYYIYIYIHVIHDTYLRFSGNPTGTSRFHRWKRYSLKKKKKRILKEKMLSCIEDGSGCLASHLKSESTQIASLLAILAGKGFSKVSQTWK